MDLFIGIIIFLLGTIIGSFLNVVIYRFNTGLGLNGRSMCFSCKKTLSWYELVPVVSFFVLRGKCNGCGSKFSFQYPFVEIVTGIVFLSVFLKFFFSGVSFEGMLILSVFYMFLWSLLIVIAVYDIRHMIIPESLVWLFNTLVFVSLFLSFNNGFHLNIPTWGTLLSGIIATMPFFLIWFFSKGRAMGFGDVKLALGLGWLVGISGAFVGVLFSFWIGALFAIFLLIFSKKGVSMKSAIPFGPFLVIAFFLVFLFNVTIHDIVAFFTF